MFAAIGVVVLLLQFLVKPGDLLLQHDRLPWVAGGSELFFKLLLLLAPALDLRVDLIRIIISCALAFLRRRVAFSLTARKTKTMPEPRYRLSASTKRR